MYCHKLHTHWHTAHFLYRILIANKNFNCTKILSKIAFPCKISHTDRQNIPNTQCMANDKTNHNVFLVQQKCQSFTKKNSTN